MNQLLEPNSSRVVYDLRLDIAKLEIMQKASLSDGPMGVPMDYGLIGSPQWWLAIETGKIKLETFLGKIREVSGGMMGDTLNVHFEGVDEIKKWVAWRGFDSMLNGKEACVRYVTTSPKRPLASRPDFKIQILLQVELIS